MLDARDDLKSATQEAPLSGAALCRYTDVMGTEQIKIRESGDWRALYPFASHYLTIGGRQYHYLDEGTGPAVLMVHGNPTWSFYWRNLILALRGRFRLIVPDHIGCGLSEKPPLESYGYRLADRIADLRTLIEHLDLNEVTLVAHDWGGAIGMGAAVEQPERFRRFALMNTAAFRSDAMPPLIRLCRAESLTKVVIQGFNGFARAATRLAVRHHERMTPEVRAGLLAPYDCWRHRLATHRFVLDVPMSPKHPSYDTLVAIEQGLSQFRHHPVSLIWGMKDWCFTPAFLDRFIEFFPDAEVHRLEDAGHYVVEDAHERIVPLLDAFLSK